MFELEPSPEFSAWFAQLPPKSAEEVACGLDVMAAAGPVLAQDHVTHSLLWFDGTGGEEIQWFGRRQLSDRVRELLHWQREAIRALESDAFGKRLASLEGTEARDVLLAVEGLKRQLTASRFHVAAAGSTSTRLTALREQFMEVLRRTGLEPSTSWTSLNGLCELTVSTAEPPLRVLLGVHAEARRILVILGEELTRAYYGDSVRLAEQRWRDYCAKEAPSLLGDQAR